MNLPQLHHVLIRILTPGILRIRLVFSEKDIEHFKKLAPHGVSFFEGKSKVFSTIIREIYLCNIFEVQASRNIYTPVR